MLLFYADSDLVVTGEWCNGVMKDFNIHPDQDNDHDNAKGVFLGRGVQYQLGFHHHNDLCAGFVSVAHSHYLAVGSQQRTLGAYFLGCEMSPLVAASLHRHHSHTDTHTDTDTDTDTDGLIMKVSSEVNDLQHSECEECQVKW